MSDTNVVNIEFNHKMCETFQTNQMVFNYNSIFKYTKVSTDDNPLDVDSGDGLIDEIQVSHPYPLFDKILHKLIVLIFYSLFIITFPISAFFCIRRIHSLERCLIYRLGIRQPLKGPGIIIKFPFIDCIEIIDLSDIELELVDKRQQMITCDGSIIEFISMNCYLNITNAIRSQTQLKDSEFNAKQFCRLSFNNLMAATHVEDLENKPNCIVEQFEHNCNVYLNNWGYNCKFKELPKFVVINRANPLNPIVSKLKSMFGGGKSEEPNELISELQKFQLKTTQSPLELNDIQIVESLQGMAEKYHKYVFHDISIRIHVQDIDSSDWFTFSQSTGKVTKVLEKPTKVNINISANSKEELMRFCCYNDMNCVGITTDLI